jgi:enamine deaminase RidA (YjgF/YER057c/UK114 family)
MTEIIHYNIRDLETAFAFSQAVRAGNTLYLSGHLSYDEDGDVIGAGDMAAQVETVYRELGQTLEANGASFASVVKESVFTTDMAALIEASGVRKAFFDGIKGPAATWVEVTRLVPEAALIEVELIAIVG